MNAPEGRRAFRRAGSSRGRARQPVDSAWVEFERRKSNWACDNPTATPHEYDLAMRRIAADVGRLTMKNDVPQSAMREVPHALEAVQSVIGGLLLVDLDFLFFGEPHRGALSFVSSTTSRAATPALFEWQQRGGVVA